MMTDKTTADMLSRLAGQGSRVDLLANTWTPQLQLKRLVKLLGARGLHVELCTGRLTVAALRHCLDWAP